MKQYIIDRVSYMRKVKFSHIVREIRFVRKVILFGEHGIFQYVRCPWSSYSAPAE